MFTVIASAVRPGFWRSSLMMSSAIVIASTALILFFPDYSWWSCSCSYSVWFTALLMLIGTSALFYHWISNAFMP